MNHDFTYCSNVTCPLRENCKRVWVPKPGNDGLLNVHFLHFTPKEGVCEQQKKINPLTPN